MPYTYEDARRVHDQAFVDWIQTFRCDYGNIAGTDRNNVPCLAVFASPDRPFAAVADILVARRWIAGATADAMRTAAKGFEVLPMPLCIIQRIGEPTPDGELSRPPGFIDNMVLNEATQQWTPHPFPRFYYTQYSVQFWSRKQTTGNLFAAWLFSNLGKQGSAHNEAMIPVQHAEPWGEMLQRVRFEGAVDTSDLEGDNPRYIRVDYTFNLRTLIMHLPKAGADFVDKIQTDVGTPGNGFGSTNETVDTLPAPAVTQSRNLWRIPMPPEHIPTYWPKDGNATVGPSTLYPKASWPAVSTGGLTIRVRDDEDAVAVFERIALLDGAGELVNAFSFRYIADQPVNLEMTQRAANAETTDIILLRTLPATAEWRKVQVYTLATAPIWSAAIRGIDGAPAPLRTMQMVDLDIRHVTSATLIPVTAQAGTDPVIYEWTGLEAGKAYLLRARATLGSALVTVLNDSVSPTQTDSFTVDATTMIGLVAFVSPKASSVRLLAPAGVSLAAPSLSRYAGHHNGNEV